MAKKVVKIEVTTLMQTLIIKIERQSIAIAARTLEKNIWLLEAVWI